MDKKKCFERFYRENYEQFFLFAYRYLNDEEACRDIVSNAFEYAWSNYEREDVPDWKPFLLSYIRHKSLDYIRHVQVHNRFVRARLQMDEDFSDVDLLEREERIVLISRHVEQLPPRTRLIFQECFINGRKYKEVGEKLDITDHAVKKHIMKALKFLRDCVKKNK